MAAAGWKETIFIDLDGTLFDQNHSLRSAIAAVQNEFPELRKYTVDGLLKLYNTAMKNTYNMYRRGIIRYEEQDDIEVRSLYRYLGLPDPNHGKIAAFRYVYRTAYEDNRRATPGTIETLCRLHEQDYYIVVLTNGQTKHQNQKAKAIGIRHLVDRIITSEEAGYPKPAWEIFDYALGSVGAPAWAVHMIGNSIRADIMGGINAGMPTMLYFPTAMGPYCSVLGKDVPVIREMTEALELLGLTQHPPYLYFSINTDQLLVERLQIDMVTEPHRCLHLSGHSVIVHMERMEQAILCVNRNDFEAAMLLVTCMIRKIARSATIIDQKAVFISCKFRFRVYWRCVASKELRIGWRFQTTIRKHSVRVEFEQLSFPLTRNDQNFVREILTLFQSHCNNLSRDCPRAALRNLRSIMLLLAKKRNIEVEIKGQGIDE